MMNKRKKKLKHLCSGAQDDRNSELFVIHRYQQSGTIMTWIDACIDNSDVLWWWNPLTVTSTPKTSHPSKPTEAYNASFSCDDLFKRITDITNATEDTDKVKKEKTALDTLDSILSDVTHPLFHTKHISYQDAKQINKTIRESMDRIHVPQRAARTMNHSEIILYMKTSSNQTSSSRSVKRHAAVLQCVSNLAAILYSKVFQNVREDDNRVEYLESFLNRIKNVNRKDGKVFPRARKTLEIIEQVFASLTGPSTEKPSTFILDLGKLCIVDVFRIEEFKVHEEYDLKWNSEDKQNNKVEIPRMKVELTPSGKNRLKSSMLFKKEAQIDKYVDEWKFNGSWADVLVNALLLSVFGTMTMDALLNKQSQKLSEEDRVNYFAGLFEMNENRQRVDVSGPRNDDDDDDDDQTVPSEEGQPHDEGEDEDEGDEDAPSKKKFRR